MIGWMAIATAAVVGTAAPGATGCDPGGETVTCEDGSEPVGDLGIEALGCDCTAHVSAGVEDRYWEFRSDLEVLGVRAGGPAEGILESGDRITALDGRALTEPATGRRFANLEPGETVVLTVRRGGETRELEVTAEGRCPPAAPPAPRAPRVDTPALPEPPREPSPLPMLPDLLPAGWLGMGIECSDCSVEREEGGPRLSADVVQTEAATPASAVWYFSAPPRIYRLDPDGPARRAGLADGDVLVSIDGVPLTDPDGGRRFGAIQPGQTVAFTVRREDERLELRVTAIEPPARASGASRATGRSRAPRAGEPAAAPLAPHPRRWSGTVGDVDVQVRGSGSMVVDVRRNGREVEIVTPDGTVLLRERSDR